tara:strand:- start:195 stop:566 length:372 start_codon:yes stop_codon:yes gene_type:complete
MSSGHNVLQSIAATSELEILDPGSGGTIQVDRSMGICSVVTGGAEARKIASPQRAGIMISICFKTDGGDLTITGEGSEILNSGAGTETTATMADAGDLLTLISIRKGSSIVWSPIANNGAAMS